MRTLRYTLLSDGSSDQALKAILDWLLSVNGVVGFIQGTWANLGFGGGKLPHKPKVKDKMPIALMAYPCDVLFVHRDAEGEQPEKRVAEIKEAWQGLAPERQIPYVCVVPVRMQEAWLLFDEPAIRHAAGNPHGKMKLPLPRWKEIESEPDPKEILHNCLKIASGLSGRRLDTFDVNKKAHRVTEMIEDFSPLRKLSAFQMLEADVQRMIAAQEWAKKG